MVRPNEETVGGQEGKEKQDRMDKGGMKRQKYEKVGMQESAETEPSDMKRKINKYRY